MGRKSTFTAEFAEAIQAGLSAGTPLTQICRELDIGVTTVYDWAANDAEFADAIARARTAGFDVIADDCLGIADDSTNDFVPGKNGPVLDAEAVARSRLRVETRLKLLAKWDPKRYGDKIQHTGDGGGAVTFAVVTAVPDPRSDPEATGEA